MSLHPPASALLDHLEVDLDRLLARVGLRLRLGLHHHARRRSASSPTYSTLKLSVFFRLRSYGLAHELLQEVAELGLLGVGAGRPLGRRARPRRGRRSRASRRRARDLLVVRRRLLQQIEERRLLRLDDVRRRAGARRAHGPEGEHEQREAAAKRCTILRFTSSPFPVTSAVVVRARRRNAPLGVMLRRPDVFDVARPE